MPVPRLIGRVIDGIERYLPDFLRRREDTRIRQEAQRGESFSRRRTRSLSTGEGDEEQPQAPGNDLLAQVVAGISSHNLAIQPHLQGFVAGSEEEAVVDRLEAWYQAVGAEMERLRAQVNPPPVPDFQPEEVIVISDPDLVVLVEVHVAEGEEVVVVIDDREEREQEAQVVEIPDSVMDVDQEEVSPPPEEEGVMHGPWEPQEARLRRLMRALCLQLRALLRRPVGETRRAERLRRRRIVKTEQELQKYRDELNRLEGVVEPTS